MKFLQTEARTPLAKIASSCRVPKSTIHYRIRKLEKEGVIQGYRAILDTDLLGLDYMAVSLIRGKYGPKYHQRLGKKLASLRGAWVVYFVFGDWDFVVLTRSKNREDLSKVIDTIISMNEVERGTTLIVSRALKEDQRVDLAKPDASL